MDHGKEERRKNGRKKGRNKEKKMGEKAVYVYTPLQVG